MNKKAGISFGLGLAMTFAALSGSGSGIPQPARSPQSPMQWADSLARTAPSLDRKVLNLATRAMTCALQHGDMQIDPTRLSVIDYSRPSTEQRLWVFDLGQQRLLFREWVAHGRNSGENMALQFSNRTGSYMSSLGGFTTQETYMGGNGYSLRLQGLEPGFNDNARDRAIVIHGASYVSPDFAQTQGRLGRSLGCPAVRSEVAHALIDAIQGGTFVFAYYPDNDWLRHSQLLNCTGGNGRLAATRQADADDGQGGI